MKVLEKLWSKSKKLKENFPSFLSISKAKNLPLYLFDLDRTLVLTNCSYLFGRFLFQKSELSLGQLIPLLFAYSLYSGGVISVYRLHHVCFSCLFRYAQSSKIELYAKEFVAKLIEKEFNPLLSGYLSDVKEGRARGIILSASPYFLVDAIAEKLGMERAYSTRYAVNEEGEFIFVESVIVPKEKARFVEELRSEYKNISFTGFGDSIEDYNFMSLCDKAVAVHPTGRFAKLAQKKMWTILYKSL